MKGIDRILVELKAKGVRLLNEQAKMGAHGCRVAFIHPASTGGVLIELSEKIASGHGAATTTGQPVSRRRRGTDKWAIAVQVILSMQFSMMVPVTPVVRWPIGINVCVWLVLRVIVEGYISS